MVETAGTKLRRARQMRHLSLEDAARATKIRANQLADLEADEYSNFANLAYARSFLVNYGKFLRVDMRPHVDGFSDAGTFGLDDYQYLSEKPVGMYRVPHRRSGRTRRPQRRQLLAAALGMAAVAVGMIGWVFVVNVQRLGDLSTLAARQEAREKAAHETGVPASETASAPADAIPAPVSGGNGPNEAVPTGVIPVSVPMTAPDRVETPAPTTSPATVPTQDAIPALATNHEPPAIPLLPLPDDGHAVREMFAAHADRAQPQKVVNTRPRGQ